MYYYNIMCDKSTSLDIISLPLPTYVAQPNKEVALCSSDIHCTGKLLTLYGVYNLLFAVNYLHKRHSVRKQYPNYKCVWTRINYQVPIFISTQLLHKLAITSIIADDSSVKRNILQS